MAQKTKDRTRRSEEGSIKRKDVKWNTRKFPVRLKGSKKSSASRSLDV